MSGFISLVILSISCAGSKEVAPAPSSQNTDKKDAGVAESSTDGSSKALDVGVPSTATGTDAPKQASLGRHPESPGVVRTDGAGCVMQGPFRGEIQSGPVGEPLELDQALDNCLRLGDACQGITSDWYTGKPYVAMNPDKTFRGNPDSYGLVYLRSCPKPE